MSHCLDYEACTIPSNFPLMIDVIGTEEYLAKIDVSHTIVFSATYGFPPGLVHITSSLLNAKFKW
jgi:hypothetical protein